MHWLEKLAFKIIDNSFSSGKVVFIDDIQEISNTLKNENEDELLKIIENQQLEIKILQENLIKLQYEIDSPMVMMNELRKEMVKFEKLRSY